MVEYTNYNVECFYKATEYRPAKWEVWHSKCSLEDVKNLLKIAKRSIKRKDCIFSDVRVMEVTHKEIKI